MCPKYFRTAKTFNNNKGIAWLFSEVCALLDVWADNDIQQELAGRLHNMCVYEKISNRLLALGIERTAEQCREKIKKLKRDYKTVTDNNYSPAFARKLLGCYDKVHEVFGKCAVVRPMSVVESLTYNEENNVLSTSQLDPFPDHVTSSWDKSTGSFPKITLASYDMSYSTNSEDSNEDSINMDLTSKYLTEDNMLDNVFNELKNSQDNVHKKISTLCHIQMERELASENNRLQQAERRRKTELQCEYKKYEALFSSIVAKYRNSDMDKD